MRPFSSNARMGCARRAGYSLVELSIGMAIFMAIALGIYAILHMTMNGYVRNFALNETGESSRNAFSRLSIWFEQSAQTPELVTFNGSAFTTNNLTGTNADAIRFVRMLGGTYRITGPVGSTRGNFSYTATNASNLVVEYLTNRSPVITTGYTAGQPGPAVGDRILILSPAGITESVTNGASPGTKPGYRITAVSLSTNGTNSLATLTLSRPVGREILVSNIAYFGRESALAAVTNGTRRELRYYDAATNVNNFMVVTRNLDDSLVSGSITNRLFALVDSNGRKAVAVNLPIQQRDYLRTLGRGHTNLGADGQRTNEFHSFLRTRATISLKNRAIANQ
jgi:hypothetical protein